MRKRLISICIVASLVYSIFGCSRTAEDTSTIETEAVETDIVEEEYVQSGEEITLQTQDNAIDHMWKECDLTWQEGPDYAFFKNAQEGCYNLTLENAVAFVVKDYALDAALEDEVWELKRIYHYRDDIYQACTESDMGSELYILFRENYLTALPDYIIAADVRKGNEGDIALPYGNYSYSSMLEWYSYEVWFDGKLSEEVPQVDVVNFIHDSSYETVVCLAIYDYVYRTNGDTENHWVVSDNDTYVGLIACAHCSNGVQDFMIFLDVANWMYAVLE